VPPLVTPEPYIVRCDLCKTQRHVGPDGRSTVPCAHELEMMPRVQPWHLHPRWIDPAYWPWVAIAVADLDREAEHKRRARVAQNGKGSL
jgi:hypothetical protein